MFLLLYRVEMRENFRESSNRFFLDKSTKNNLKNINFLAPWTVFWYICLKYLIPRHGSSQGNSTKQNQQLLSEGNRSRRKISVNIWRKVTNLAKSNFAPHTKKRHQRCPLDIRDEKIEDISNQPNMAHIGFIDSRNIFATDYLHGSTLYNIKSFWPSPTYWRFIGNLKWRRLLRNPVYISIYFYFVLFSLTVLCVSVCSWLLSLITNQWTKKKIAKAYTPNIFKGSDETNCWPSGVYLLVIGKGSSSSGHTQSCCCYILSTTSVNESSAIYNQSTLFLHSSSYNTRVVVRITIYAACSITHAHSKFP